MAQKQFAAFAREIATHASSLLACVKTLSTSLSDDSRAACTKASQPLMDVVQRLLTFASTDEFANSPATVSEAAREAMTPTIQQAQGLVSAACDMIATGRSLMVDNSSAQLWQKLSEESDRVGEAIKLLVKQMKIQIPGRSICMRSAEAIDAFVSELEHVATLVSARKTLGRTDTSAMSPADQIMSHIEGMGSALLAVFLTAKTDAVILSHNTHLLMPQLKFAPCLRLDGWCLNEVMCRSLLAAVINLVSRVKVKSSQASLVALAKRFMQAVQLFLNACKESSGNPRLADFFPPVDAAFEDAQVG